VALSDDEGLRRLLAELDPKARNNLRRALIGDQADRDAIASQLMRYRDQSGQVRAVASLQDATRKLILQMDGNATGNASTRSSDPTTRYASAGSCA
jgi:hypothetical protein